MFKPRRIHRREEQKDRLYDALRKLYAEGVRVCKGRPAPTIKPARPAQAAPAVRPAMGDEPLILEIDDVAACDPYNRGAR